jgi:hypothetical protein
MSWLTAADVRDTDHHLTAAISLFRSAQYSGKQSEHRALATPQACIYPQIMKGVTALTDLSFWGEARFVTAV